MPPTIQVMRDVIRHPICQSFGLEVRGLDLSNNLTEQTLTDLSHALMEHKLILLRDQKLSTEQFAQFGRSWSAKTRIDGFEEMTVPGFRDINIVGNVGELYKNEGYRNGAAFWHTDCAAESDSNATTMLYCIHALHADGETVFADMEEAYRTLPEHIKQEIQELSGLHCYAGARPVLGGRESWEYPLTPVTEDTASQLPPPVSKPLVRKHSVTGRLGLYAPAGSMFAIEGMKDHKAHKLMRSLKNHATNRRFTYKHFYQPGDLVIWDNSCTMHYAKPTEAARGAHDRRLMHRICPLGLPVHL